MEALDETIPISLEELLEGHPGVGAFALHREGDRITVRVEPDSETAPELAKALSLEAEVRAAGLDIFEPNRKWLVVGKNKLEADFLYREIVEGNEYLKYGIALGPGSKVVDVGANIGMFSLLAAKTGPGSRVIAVEPIPEIAEAVRFNARLHDLDISVHNCALGAAAGEIEFTYYPHNTVMSGRFADDREDRRALKSYLSVNASGLDDGHLEGVISDRMAGRKIRCPMTTLMDIVQREGLEEIDLLKIDVEKSEAEVLGGITGSFWPRIHQIVLEVHDESGRLAALREMLEGKGYRVQVDRNADMAQTSMFTLYARRPGYQAKTGAREPSRAECLTYSSFREEIRDRISGMLRERGLEAVIRLESPLSEASEAEAHPVVPHAGPASQVEAKFRAVWCEILKTETVDPDSDFFGMGGTSLGAVRMIMRLEEEFGKDCLPPENFFSNSLYKDLIRVVAGKAAP
jgi:FkbM family methyltransferase